MKMKDKLHTLPKLLRMVAVVPFKDFSLLDTLKSLKEDGFDHENIFCTITVTFSGNEVEVLATKAEE